MPICKIQQYQVHKNHITLFYEFGYKNNTALSYRIPMRRCSTLPLSRQTIVVKSTDDNRLSSKGLITEQYRLVNYTPTTWTICRCYSSIFHLHCPSESRVRLLLCNSHYLVLLLVSMSDIYNSYSNNR